MTTKTPLSRFISWMLIPLALILLAGCGATSSETASRYQLKFQAHPQINDSAPLKVRVLLLKSDANFMSADFYSLQNKPDAVLGNDLLNADQFFLMPGQLNKLLRGQTQPGARYIGIMAEYQTLDGKKWRLSLPLPDPSQGSTWKFWQSNSGELNAEIIADISGIRTLSPQN
ncbi:type VI secretion system lipoprotein TssJ [Candidatus Pantoea multigeneris]|nr:type VI secretion system lipoprotein TssJ [Pantoea multigeneris]